LFVGGPGHPRKGARYLLEALQPLWAQGACVILDVVGAADDATTQRLRRLPHVRHHQDVSTHKLAALYRSCDALVAPATGQESFGIILLEAMATAKPIIATDIEGYRRVLDSGHEPGALLVPPKDAPALRGAIARLMAMPAAERAAMGAQNHRNVAPFTWDTVTQKLRALYLGAMAEAQASS
jgi:phosphatidylinositol alpha-mannosyltransferase